MLNISVSFFNILSKFVQTFVPSVNKLLNAQCKEWLQVTCPKGYLPEGSFVRNVVVQIPKFDAKPNRNHNLT